MQYNLTNNPILTPYQITILRTFFDTDFAKPFFLTGGTALSAFYYAHRESKDLDFFSLSPFSVQQLNQIVVELANATSSVVNTKVQTPMYHEVYLENKSEGWIQRLDFVQEQPIRFGQPRNIDGIIVDTLENIGSNKICAIFGRLEIKDYIDLYAILTQSKLTFDHLFELSKQKDLGLNEFTLGSSIVDLSQISIWPILKKDLDKGQINKFYQDLSINLLKRAKPKNSD